MGVNGVLSVAGRHGGLPHLQGEIWWALSRSIRTLMESDGFTELGLNPLTPHVSLLERTSQTGNPNSSSSELRWKSKEVNHVKLMFLGEFTCTIMSEKMLNVLFQPKAQYAFPLQYVNVDLLILLLVNISFWINLQHLVNCTNISSELHWLGCN